MNDTQEAQETRRPFAPRQEQSEWRLVYEALLQDADFGSVITYPELDEVLGRPFRDNRSPVYRANRELEDLRKRHLESVPNVGYRVIEAKEHLSAAEQRKRRAKRQLGQMMRITAATDLERLDTAQLDAHQRQSCINAAIFAIMSHHEARIMRIETILQREGLLGKRDAG